MRVKRYVVDSMPDALQKIRADLGKDAIIINTKNIKTGGFLGLFARRQIEVIAAIDVNKGPTPTIKPAVAATSIVEEKEKLPLINVHDSSRMDEIQPETNIYNLKTLVAKRTSISNEPKDEFKSLISQEVNTSKETPLAKNDTISVKDFDFSPLRTRLMKQEVEPKIVEDIITIVQSRYSASILQTELSQVQHAKLVIEEMLKKYHKRDSLIGRNTRFVKFFGPTGVGKTTTIAKLAAEAVLKNKRKVGFITTDTYRIGAVDQLKTYANILNIPLEVVYQPREMNGAITSLEACDLILMDTAGRNYRNRDSAVELIDYFPNMEGTENYIVMSLTAKNSDMIETLDNFKHILIDKVIFTKADETNTYGSILNMVSNYNLSLSYLTTGQNVPDDIRVASIGKVANLILGEDRYV